MAKGKPVGTAYAELDLDSNKMERGLQRVHDSLVKGTIKTEDAFKQLGIKSDSVYEKMRQNATLAFEKIASSSKATANDIVRAEQAKADKLKSIHEQQFGKQISLLDQAKSAALSVGGAISIMSAAAVAYKAVEFGKELVSSGLASERLSLSLKASTGSYQASVSAMSFLRYEAQRLGTDLVSSADGFVKLSASAKGTALEGEKTREIFTAVATASTALKLSNEQSSGALYAISQMMSKGTVQSEELRGQLGERLPGAFNLAAKAMGVTTAELGKMLEQGQVVAADFLPKFARVLTQEYGAAATEAADSTQAATNRMNNAWVEAKRSIGETLLPAIASAAEAVNSLIQSIAPERLSDANKIIALAEKVANIKGRMTQPGMTWVLGDDLKKAEAELAKLEYRVAGITMGAGDWAKGARDLAAAENDIFSKGDTWRTFGSGMIAANDRGAKEYLAALAKEGEEIKGAAKNYFNTIDDVLGDAPQSTLAALDKIRDEWEKMTLSAHDYTMLNISQWFEKEAAALGGEHEMLVAIRKERERIAGIVESKRFADRELVYMPAGYNSDSFIGMKAADERAAKMIADATKNKDQLISLSEHAAKAMEKNFSDFYFDSITGKLSSLADFWEGILNTLARMTSDILGQITRETLFGVQGGGQSLASQIVGLFTTTENAAGGVYSGHGISAYSNKIVDRPTIFPFARGMGLMGEAGAEAIMPLTRMAGGSLGVKATGAAAPNVTIQVNNQGTPQEYEQQDIYFDGDAWVIGVIAKDLRTDKHGLRTMLGGR